MKPEQKESQQLHFGLNEAAKDKPSIIIDAPAFRARQAYLDVKVADLAAQAHSSVATVVKLRKGNPAVSLEAAARIAAGLGLRVRVSFELIEE